MTICHRCYQVSIPGNVMRAVASATHLNFNACLTVSPQVQKMGEKLQGLQEEKHQLFLQLKKVLHEEEKRRRKEQRYRTMCLLSLLTLLFNFSLLHLVTCFSRCNL